ncbi:MAG: hypothetical protein D3917_19575 [Candidatus Electrothrix sp. AX5]|nr:hypothetical protein [Candidatus Electrothrix sp. AX5]
MSNDLEESMRTAIATFAYELYIGYPDAETNLQDTIKTLASTYLMLGDEFLIDALEWRFSSDSLGLEEKIDEQIMLLIKARLCYDSAVNVFINGFSPAVGTALYISDYFNATLFNLFHLAVERLSTVQREQAAKILARDIAPGSADDARAQAAAVLRPAYTNAYLLTAALGQKEGANFLAYGGDRLHNALQSLQNQAAIYTRGLNPLGFDDRYVPMQDFTEVLYPNARASYTTATSSYGAFEAEKRDFDHIVEQLRATHNSLATNMYREKLASLTGLPMNSSLEDFAAAGEDLYACDEESKDFFTCMGGKTGGVLGNKYNQFRTAQLRIDDAELFKKQTIELLEQENEKYAKLNTVLLIQDKNNDAVQAVWEEFLEDMKDARTKVKTYDREKKGVEENAK